MTPPNPSGGLATSLAEAEAAVVVLTAAVKQRTAALDAAAIQPDLESVHQHVAAVGHHFAVHFPGCLLEIRAIHPAGGRAVVARQFPCATSGYAAAVRWATARNERGFNVYVGACPRRAGTPSDRAASAADIVGAVFLVLDLDDADDARGTIASFDPTPSFVVITGTRPHVRAQCGWPLAQPVLDLREWGNLQRLLAARFGGDPAVSDAPRVMRLGGTVSYPNARKQVRGYVAEVTSIDADADASPISADGVTNLCGGDTATGLTPSANSDDPFADLPRTTLPPPSEECIREALSWIPPDVKRTEWIKVCGGLRDWEVLTGTEALPLFLEWSRGDLHRDGPRAPASFAGEDDCRKTWDSLK